MSWFRKTLRATGSALFRGKIPPRLHELTGMPQAGVSVRPSTSPRPEMHWSAELEHSHWGRVELFSLRDAPSPPPELFEYDGRLTRAERDSMKQGGSLLTIRQDSPAAAAAAGNVLRDRKNLFRFLHALLGDDGLGVMDHTSQRIWSPDALADELSHDADLDIDAIFHQHAVRMADDGADEDEQGRPRVTWLHTHGLAEIGFFDFDIIRPAPELLNTGQDLLRAIAFAIVEGTATIGSTPQLTHPPMNVQFVDVATFHQRASAQDAACRDRADGHDRKRVVLCDANRGGFRKFLGRGTVRPCVALSTSGTTDGRVIAFSNDAGELAAQRARNTFGQFRQMLQEFAEFDLPCLAKIGYRADAAGPGAGYDSEHLWFRVHGTRDDALDATLESQPHHIASMRPGQRGWHPLSQLSDWTISTPIGLITPRDTACARVIRSRPEVFREILSQFQRPNPPDNVEE